MPLQVLVRHLGTINFATGLHEQHKAQALVRHQRATVVLLVCEHSPTVITLGRHGNPESIIASSAHLKQRHIEVIRTTRGGDATVHFKGQLVIYPILWLKAFNLGVKAFVSTMETSVITALAQFGITALTLDHLPGIWRQSHGEHRKIAALGFAVQKGLTCHGLAINITDDLSAFAYIKPCGLAQDSPYGVCSVLDSLPSHSSWRQNPALTATVTTAVTTEITSRLRALYSAEQLQYQDLQGGVSAYAL